MVLGKGPTSFFYLWKSSTLPDLTKPHPKHVQFSMPPKTQGDPYVNFEFSLHSSLFSDALLHKFYSLLSLQTLIRLPSSAILHSVLELSFSTSWPRKYVWQEAGGIIEHTLFLFPGCLCQEDTPVPVTTICLEAKFSPYLSCLITSCSLLTFFRSFCLFKHWKHSLYIVPDNSNIQSLVCLI